jgi:hypothetical protein
MRNFSLLAMAFALILVAACAKAPEIEMQSSQAAMQAAVGAEAAEYALGTYQMAVDTLKAAEAALKEQDAKFGLFRNYGKVKQLFASAQALAEKANAEAVAEKERMKGELTGMLVGTQALLDSANVMLTKAPRGKGSKADIELIKTDLASAATAMDQAKADFEGGRYKAALAGLTGIQDKARSILAEIEAAFALKK